MFRPSLRRIAALALCLAMAGSGVLAAKPRATVSPDSAAVSKGGPTGFLDTVWSFLVSVWAKNGASPDPYGGPKNGSGVDPYGGRKNGAGADPFGKPSSGPPNGDNGSAGDPDGD